MKPTTWRDHRPGRLRSLSRVHPHCLGGTSPVVLLLGRRWRNARAETEGLERGWYQRTSPGRRQGRTSIVVQVRVLNAAPQDLRAWRGDRTCRRRRDAGRGRRWVPFTTPRVGRSSWGTSPHVSVAGLAAGRHKPPPQLLAGLGVGGHDDVRLALPARGRQRRPENACPAALGEATPSGWGQDRASHRGAPGERGSVRSRRRYSLSGLALMRKRSILAACGVPVW